MIPGTLLEDEQHELWGYYWPSHRLRQSYGLLGSFRTYWSLLIRGWFIGGVAVVVLWMEGMKLRVLKQERGVLQRCPAKASLRVPRDTKTGIDFDKPSCIT